MGHRTVIKATCRDVVEILFKGLDHLSKGNTEGSSRDYDLLIRGSLLKRSCLMTVLFINGNQSGSILEVRVWKVIQFSYLS